MGHGFYPFKPGEVARPFEHWQEPDLSWQTLAFLHNISTPLSTLASLIDSLPTDLTPTISQTLHATVHSLLNATHLQAATITGCWQPVPIEITSTTIKILPLLKKLAAPYQLRTSFPAECIVACGNVAAWEQILVNFTKNSWQALNRLQTTESKQTGWISLTLRVQHNTWSLIWSDSGPGIPTSIWRACFKPHPHPTSNQLHGFGLRSVRFWWKTAFGGKIQLRRGTLWSLHLTAPRQTRGDLSGIFPYTK